MNKEVHCHVINAGIYLVTIKEANPRTKLAGRGHRAERDRESFHSSDSFTRRACLTPDVFFCKQMHLCIMQDFCSLYI